MLQQILNDMYVDPDVLDGLNDDQKKTLFLKMRQEQVRRWTEREEKLEREGGDIAESKRRKPRKASSKSVSWLLGRDGDVSVIVIEEELTSFICTAAEEKTSSSLQNNCHQNFLKSQKSTEVKSDKEIVSLETQPEISSNVKGKCEEKSTLLHLVVSAAENSAPTEAKKLDVRAEEKSAPQASSCSRPTTRSGLVSVRPASANLTPGCASPPSSSSSCTVKSNSASASLTKGGLGSMETQKPQESQGMKGVGASGMSRRPDSAEPGTSGTAPTCTGRGRVAQLMKTFSADTPTQTTSRGIKPPLPTKPSHLRLTTR